MRLPADEIGHPGCDRLLDDEIVGEARDRPADENQQRHSQKLAAVILIAEFRSVIDAARCAVEVQSAISGKRLQE